MKNVFILFAGLAFALLVLCGCSTPDTLPPMPDYKSTDIKYNTSAVIEYLPQNNELIDRFMLENLKNNGYQVQTGINYRTAPPSNLYMISVINWESAVFECQDNKYIDTRVIVMVRRPGIILDKKMYSAQARYFQAYSQLVLWDEQTYESGLKLAMEHLFLTDEFRKALEPVPPPAGVLTPSANAQAQWQASLYYQQAETFDFYQSLRWAFTALANGSSEAKDYLAQYGLFGEIFSDMELLKELAAQTPQGMYKLGVMYEHGRGIAVNKQLAFRAYNIAAWKQIPEAQYALGRCYHYGIGVKKSRSLAHHWYSKAAAADHPAANLANEAMAAMQEENEDR